MFLLLDEVCFHSNDFDNVLQRKDSANPMIHNIMKVADSHWKESIPDKQIHSQQYLYQPAFFRFSTPIDHSPLAQVLKQLQELCREIRLEGIWKEIVTAFLLYKEQRKESPNKPPSVPRSVCPVKDFLSQCTLNKTYQDHRQSQLMSQLCFYSVIDTQIGPVADQEEESNRLILPVIAYDAAIEKLFCGIPASLVALSVLSRKKSDALGVDYASICFEALKKLGSSKQKNVLVIVNFVRSWNEQEDLDADGPSDSIGNFVAILDQLVI